MIMLASVMPTPNGSRRPVCKTVAEAGGNTQAPYIVIDDVDAHAERARAAGAEIIVEPEDQDYGGRVYSARDPEGYVWSFGSYDPWAAEPSRTGWRPSFRRRSGGSPRRAGARW